MEKNNDIETQIQDILDAFKIFDGVYKKEQVHAAIELTNEITPYLLKILETVLDNPEKYAEDSDLWDHIYASMLLAHFKEEKAHKLIVDLFSLPGETPDALYGDLGTSNLPAFLFNTCGGSMDLIKPMILNRDIDDYVRISACQAMAYAVVEGYVPREDVIEFIGTLFTGNEADEISDFWGLLAGIVWDLYPEENMEIIKQAYDNDLIAPGLIGYEDFQDALDMGKEKCLENLKNDLDMHSLNDLDKAMSWWACFDENKDRNNLPNPDIFQSIPDQNFMKAEKKKKAPPKRKAAKKKKRKQSKKSRKKNRK